MQKPLYTLHPGAAVPSVPPRFSSPEQFAASLARFNAAQYRIGRRSALQLIDHYEGFSADIRHSLEPIERLAHHATQLEQDSEIPSDAAGALADIVARLKALRQSPAVNALEDLPSDPVTGPYITRLAQHYPEQPDIDRSSPRTRLRSTLMTVRRDMQPSAAKDLEMNRIALDEVVGAQDHVLQSLSVIDGQLAAYEQRNAQRNQAAPSALGELHQNVLSLVEQLKEKATRFSQVLEWQIGQLHPITHGAAIGR